MKTISFENIYAQTKDVCKALKISVPTKKRFMEEGSTVAMDIMSFVVNNKVSDVLKNRAVFVACDICKFAEAH